MHAFDRRTDRQTEFSSLDRVCIACSAEKIYVNCTELNVKFGKFVYCKDVESCILLIRDKRNLK